MLDTTSLRVLKRTFHPVEMLEPESQEKKKSRLCNLSLQLFILLKRIMVDD